jgi:hypothetical protein
MAHRFDVRRDVGFDERGRHVRYVGESDLRAGRQIADMFVVERQITIANQARHDHTECKPHDARDRA